MMCKAGLSLVLVGLLAGFPALADQFSAGTPTLRLATETDHYRTTTPALQMVVLPGGYSATTPTLTLKTDSDGYRTTTPKLIARTNQQAFRATTPALFAVINHNGFRASTPALRAVVKSGGFRARTPALRIATAKDPGNVTQPTQETPAPGPTTSPMTRCEGLLQCFSADDILRVEADLTSLGYTPETYPAFCQDIAQSLGECRAMPSGPGGLPVPGAPVQPGPPDSETPGLALTRCLPLERYAIDLQKRSDQGEDTNAEEERLTLIIVSASRHLLNGRADRYCTEITANLP